MHDMSDFHNLESIYIKTFGNMVIPILQQNEKKSLPMSCFFGFSVSPAVVNPSYKKTNPVSLNRDLTSINVTLV